MAMTTICDFCGQPAVETRRVPTTVRGKRLDVSVKIVPGDCAHRLVGEPEALQDDDVGGMRVPRRQLHV